MSSIPQQQVADSIVKPERQAVDTDRRILIVDDEDLVRNMFADFLSEKYECTTASSSDEALAHLAMDAYALVISDMTMPGRNGVELLREVVTRYPETLVIMVSGVDRPQRIRDALRLGAFDYLIKPCELEVLGFSIERALQRRELMQTAKQYKADLERQNAELAEQKAALELLQAKLIESEKMASLGELAAGVAHELNNPAGFIYGNMDLLAHYTEDLQRLLDAYQRVPLPDDAVGQIAALKDEIRYESLMSELSSIIGDCSEGAERIRDVVQNLRLFTRMDGTEATTIDLHEGLDSTIRLLSRYYGSGPVRLTREYSELPPVTCYSGQLNQVWMNLLVNAAQAVDKDGAVKIATRYDGDSVTIEISDNGCGISAAELNRVFDPFFTTKPLGEGTGLGLSITYGIIKRHRGTISVHSVLGQGTTFTVTIPVVPPPQQDSEQLPNQQQMGDETK